MEYRLAHSFLAAACENKGSSWYGERRSLGNMLLKLKDKPVASGSPRDILYPVLRMFAYDHKIDHVGTDFLTIELCGGPGNDGVLKGGAYKILNKEFHRFLTGGLTERITLTNHICKFQSFD